MIPPEDVPEIAQANLQRLLKTALPDGVFCFGGQYASPSPLAPRKRQKHFVSDVIVRSTGQWSNASCFQHGDDIVGLLAHLRKVGRGMVIADLAQRLNPIDRNADRIIPQAPGKNPKAQIETTPVEFVDKLAKVGVSPRVRSEELLKLAAMDRPRRRSK